MQKTQIRSLGQEDALKKEMATHSSILAWEIPTKEKPYVLQSMGSQRVGHELVTEQQYLSTRTVIRDKEGCYIIIKWKIPPSKCLGIYKESNKMYEEKSKKKSKEK